MNKKFKRLVSSALAVIMTVSTFMVVNVQNVLADEAKYFAVNFNKGDTNGGKTAYSPCYVDSDSNVLESDPTNARAVLTGFTNRTDNYGTQAGANATIVINNIPSYARIDIGINDVGGWFKIKSDNAEAQFAEYAASSYIEFDTDNVIATNTATTGAWKNNSAGYVKSIYYKSGTGTDSVTLTTQTGTTYLPYIAVYSVDAFSMSDSSEATVTGRITCSDNTIDLTSVNFDLNGESLTVDSEGNFSKTVTLSSEYVIKSNFLVNSKYYLYAKSSSDSFGTLQYKSVGDKWDFSSEANQKAGYKYEKSSGYYLGLYVDASSGKFASNNGGWFQTNSGTKIYIPVSSNLDKVNVVTYNNNVYTLEYEDGTYGKCQKLTMTANDYIKSIEVIQRTPVTLTGTYTGDVSKIYFTDDNNNTYEATLNTTAKTYSILLASGIEYTIGSDDNSLAATPGTVNISADGTQNISFSAATYVNVSGTITSDTGAGNFVSSITFTDIDDSSVSFTSVVTGNTYSVDVLPNRNYTTSAVTSGGMTTSNRVAVGSTDISNEEVYFVTPSSTVTYNYSNIASLAHTGSVTGRAGNNDIHCGTATITVPVSSPSKVTVTGYYLGEWNINGVQDTYVSLPQNSGENSSSLIVSSNATINILSETYLKKITVEPVVVSKSSITVGSEGDYKTLSAALEAANAMDRSGLTDSNGIVTIKLLEDLEEQVNETANDVIINGDGHTLSWYYAYGGKYYSADSNGYYSEELFRDKFEKKPAKGTFWGGVLIVRGNNVRVENLTIKNTFNYNVTAKELEDGSEKDTNLNEAKGNWTRTSVNSNVKTSTERERANALAVFGDKAEFYNCSILSSQDTLGVSSDVTSSHSYFKNCTIGGNVDYICGGGTMVFDSCTLQWFNDGTSSGYITAPRVSSCPYYFLNCEITAESGLRNDFNGYFGRPWVSGNSVTSTAYFINTDTNGKIADAGWIDWSSNNVGSATDANFYEFANVNNGTAFKSTIGDSMSISDYNNVVGNFTTILGNWTPNYYEATVVNDVNKVEARINDKDYVIVYGFVSADDIGNVDEAGFTLSKNNIGFAGTSALSDKVYRSVNYTDSTGSDATLEEVSGKYYTIAVVEKQNANIYAVASDSNGTYGKAAELMTVS